MTMHTSKQNRLSLELLDRTGKPYPAPFFNGDEIKAAGQLLLDVADALAKGARTINPTAETDPTVWTGSTTWMGPTDSLSEALKSAGITAVATDDDGWIEWHGRNCPVDPDTYVDVDAGAFGKACEFDWAKVRRYRIPYQVGVK